ncbi:hypothetical protein DSL72_000634 [Monilinia vaccinii-corymbosi]|uniref:Amidoligase enzyme n=1 Tax=Monilinia vaccinii-corymbosi TaxID=61207 RepID=A0A8A3NZW3_9HELO|nr:hypothetical protein DSL72_000634 [Monilinia vaccinii-corymbosi]
MSQITNPATEEANTELTFGIELEYILSTVAPGRPNPHPADPREVNGEILWEIDPINYDILEKLREVGVPATVVSGDYKCKVPVLDEDRLTTWLLKSDSSVGVTEADLKADRYVEYGLEISSPPYHYNQASREVIETVVRTLRKNYLVRVNATTGFHVHVGNGFSGIESEPLRNLMAIAWTYERQIHSIFSEERMSSKWCRSFDTSKLCKHYPGLTRLELLNRILSFSSVNEIVWHFHSHLWSIDRLVFNIENLSTPYHSEKRTIEFRHHPGTLDLEAILHWLHVCVKLVEKAYRIKDNDELFARLRADADKPIGCGEDQSIQEATWFRNGPDRNLDAVFMGNVPEFSTSGKDIFTDLARTRKPADDIGKRANSRRPTSISSE